MANTVTFKIKIEGENEIKSVTVDAEQMGRAFEAVQSNVKGLKSELVSLSSIVQLIDGATSAVGQLQGILSSYISAYAAGEAAETRLAQAMRNTMGASDEEIQSIKDLAVAQQQLGIVDAGVQLAAARPLLQFYYVMKDDETSTLDRILIYAAIFYIILPMDLIPSVIYKFLGVLDDGVAMLYIHKRIKEKITPEINDMVESTLDEWFEDAYKPGIV